MQENKKKEVCNDYSQGKRGSCGDPPDPMDSYWEQLRVDGQFSRWQKPATD